MLAAGFVDLLVGAGITVPYPVDLTCSGGRQLTTAHHVAWLMCQGVPWLGNLLPYAAGVVLRDPFSRPATVPSRCAR
jgi:hypothetical protein